MVTIDEAHQMLDEIAESLPEVFYKELNGGICLLPEAKISPYAQKGDLWIMGEYVTSSSMGRLINIYYGSFQKAYGHVSAKTFKEELRETLLHEFTHHLEDLAGENDLEKWDEQQLERYFGRR
ncbi:MAG: metallopeptidase family protein [Anaerovoracaceae bacterium]